MPSTNDGASNQASTARRLALSNLLRNLKFKQKEPQNATESANGIRGIFNLQGEYEKSQKVKEALNNTYDKEEQFDIALFDALKSDLENMGVKFKVDKDKDYIFFEEVTTEHGSAFGFRNTEQGTLDKPSEGDYAFGLARQAPKTTNEAHESNNAISHSINTSLSKKQRFEHACCIFEFDGSYWKIKGAFSVVELKMNNTSGKCKEEPVENDPSIQPTCYVLEYVWPSICEFSLVDPEKEMAPLPIALIAAQRTGNKERKMNRVFKASLEVPDKWGAKFGAQGHFYQTFDSYNTDKDKEGAKDHATNLYMETMLEGIKLLKKCSLEMGRDGKKFPSPLSGFPPESLTKNCKNYEFCGSPLLSSKEVEQFQGKHYISQGDLHYFSELDLSDLVENKNNMWLKEEFKVNDVFVKVWSPGAHRSLQSIEKYDAAYMQIFYRLTGEKDLKHLSNVFYGAYFTGVAALTVTRKINGTAVKPEKLGHEELKRYWKAFKTLCNDVLVPLANIGIIHQDLRAGYDCTYNIMADNDTEELQLRLIDYESLCVAKSYMRPHSREVEGKTKHLYPEENAVNENRADYILFQQCVGIAYAWIAKKNAEEMHFPDAFKWFSNLSDVKVGPSMEDWWNGKNSSAKSLQYAIEEVCNILEKEFVDDGDVPADTTESNNRKRPLVT